MLLGEHAVLSKNHAVVCAINKYIQVSAELITHTKSDNAWQCIIVAPNFGQVNICLDNLTVKPPFTFVLQAMVSFLPQLKQLTAQLKCDLQLTINAQFSATLGFGSSSAVTVATIAAVHNLIYQEKLLARDLLMQAHKVVRAVQIVGSGADLAASIYGGVISYNSLTYLVEQLPDIGEFYLIYAGYKTATADVIAHVAQSFKEQPQQLDKIYKLINQNVHNGVQAIKKQDYTALKNIFDDAYALQQQLQISDPVLDEIITLAANGSKISGSGLGDCIITFNEINSTKYAVYPIKVSMQGLKYND
jgi:mevalonate kinase